MRNYILKYFSTEKISRPGEGEGKCWTWIFRCHDTDAVVWNAIFTWRNAYFAYENKFIRSFSLSMSSKAAQGTSSEEFSGILWIAVFQGKCAMRPHTWNRQFHYQHIFDSTMNTSNLHKFRKVSVWNYESHGLFYLHLNVILTFRTFNLSRIKLNFEVLCSQSVYCADEVVWWSWQARKFHVITTPPSVCFINLSLHIFFQSFNIQCELQFYILSLVCQYFLLLSTTWSQFYR